MDERLLAGDPEPEEREPEKTLRPRALGDFVGQTKLKETLGVFLTAARRRREPLDHVLLFGPPGLGKTTLAHIIAREMGAQVRVTAGPVLEKAGDLAAILTNLGPGDVLFIDEIHRIPAAVEEILYPALEDGKLDLVIGTGPAARTVELRLQPFTLVGATTRAGLLSTPLTARFGITHRLDYYDTAALKTIVLRSAEILGCPIDEEGAGEIARRSRGTPRIANRLLRRVRDFVEVAGESRISAAGARGSLDRLEVDHFGLDELDRRILGDDRRPLRRRSGGPLGPRPLARRGQGDSRGPLRAVPPPVGLPDADPEGARRDGARLPAPRPPSQDGRGAPLRRPGVRRGLLVYNPAAGGRDRTAQMAALAERARGRGVVLSLLATERPGHATELVAGHLAERPDLVAVAGGDGTVAEAASALEGSDVPLAILPAGTTNVVARELGLGKSPEEAAEFLSSTATRTLTTWPSAGRTSLICTGVGFDARVMANVNPTLKRLFGRVGFSLTATYEWCRYEFPPIEVTGLDADGAPFTRRATFVVAANTSKYAGDAILSPFADPGDDLLDLVLFTSEQPHRPPPLLPPPSRRQGAAARRPGRRAIPGEELHGPLPRGVRAGGAGRRRRRRDDTRHRRPGRRQGPVPRSAAARTPDRRDRRGAGPGTSAGSRM